MWSWIPLHIDRHRLDLCLQIGFLGGYVVLDPLQALSAFLQSGAETSCFLLPRVFDVIQGDAGVISQALDLWEATCSFLVSVLGARIISG